MNFFNSKKKDVDPSEENISESTVENANKTSKSEKIKNKAKDISAPHVTFEELKTMFIKPKIAQNANIVIGFDRDLTQCRIMRINGSELSTATVEVITCKSKMATDVDFFQSLTDHFASYIENKPCKKSSAVYLVLSDRMVSVDQFTMPAMKKSLLRHALQNDFNALHRNSKGLLMNSFVLARSRSSVTYNVVSVQKSVLADVYKALAQSKFYSKKTTYSANATINAVLYLRPKLRAHSFFFVDMKEEYSTLIAVSRGKTVGFVTIPYGYKLLTFQRIQYESGIAYHPEAEAEVIAAKEKARSQSVAPQADAVQSVPAEEIMLSARSQKRIPKFLQRELPDTKEKIPIENFRIILKWILLFVRESNSSPYLAKPEFVMVNAPKEYNYVVEAFGKGNELKENGIEIRAFHPETENNVELTFNLDLFGGLLMKMFNLRNNL